ncbi:uncharacterized protein TNCV_2532401 [Trichonephila clavipes]|nr:uncharacterized protein TNCV_2532401 [Trichonephila clavipes]
MENIRKRLDIRLCCDAKKVEKLIAKPNFNGRTIFEPNLAAIHMNKTKVLFNKPIYVDSFIYDIRTDDFYEDMKGVIDYFDTSDYQENNRYGMPRVIKKVLGKMKVENDGKILEEFAGLRSKMYACKTEKDLIKKSKGVKNEAFIEEYATEEDWPIISHFQKLSEPFMDEHEEDLEWSILCRFQKISENVMEKHLNLLNWVAVSHHQTLSEPFIRKYHEIFRYGPSISFSKT